MDMATLPYVMSQPKIQQHSSIVALETAMDTKKHGNSTIDMIQNVSIDPNVRQKLDAIADKQVGLLHYN